MKKIVVLKSQARKTNKKIAKCQIFANYRRESQSDV